MMLCGTVADLHAKQAEIDTLYDTKITLSKELEVHHLVATVNSFGLLMF